MLSFFDKYFRSHSNLISKVKDTGDIRQLGRGKLNITLYVGPNGELIGDPVYYEGVHSYHCICMDTHNVFPVVAFKTKDKIDNIKLGNEKIIKVLRDDGLNESHPAFELQRRMNLINKTEFKKFVHTLVETHFPDVNDDTALGGVYIVFENHVPIDDVNGLFHTDKSNRELLTVLNKPSADPNHQTDVYGNVGVINNKPLKTTKLKKIGMFAPYMSNDQATFNIRYGLSTNERCRLTESYLKNIRQTLEFINANNGFKCVRDTDRDHVLVTNATGKIDEIKLDLDWMLTDLGFTKKKQNTEFAKDVEQTNEKIWNCLSGKTIDQTISEYDVLVFIKTKGAPVTLRVATYDFKTLQSAMKVWHNGCEKRHRSIGGVPTKIPTIFKMMKVINTRWNYGCGITGNHSTKYTDVTIFDFMSYGECLRLYLERDETVANKIFKLFSEYHINLIRDVSTRYSNGWDIAMVSGKKTSRWDVCYIPTILSICFEIKGLQMENDVSYALGTYLRCLDNVHKMSYDLREQEYPQSGFAGSRYIAEFSRGRNIQETFGRMWGNSAIMALLTGLKTKKFEPDSNHDMIVRSYRKAERELKEFGMTLPNTFSNEQKCALVLGYMG